MATHAPRFVAFGMPRPGRAALPLLALTLVALLFLADPQLRLAGLAAAACFALAAMVRAAHASAELRSVRRVADRLILADAHGAEGADVVRWRKLELVLPASREALAREIEQTLRRADPARLPSAAPLRRGVTRRNEELLRKLEERMRDGRPVTARGVILLQRLLREPGSPLYDDVRESRLPRAITTVLTELEP